jgi:hypothetical protein
VNRIRVRLGLVLTLPLWTCVPLVPREEIDLPVAHASPDPDQAIDRTRRAFTQAAQNGDIQAMARFFTADGMVITATGDTVRGREALAQFLATDRAGPTAAVLHFGQFSREAHLQQCTDGGNERGRLKTTATLSGPYSVRWQWDSLGNARIQRITFVAQAAVRPLGPSGCYVPLVVRQQSKRVALSLYLVPSAAGNPGGSVESVMRQEDWHGGSLKLVCPSWTSCTYHDTPWTQLSSAGRPLQQNLRIVSFRFSPRLGTEVMVGTRRKGSTIGLDSAGTTQLEAMWSGDFFAAAVTYERYGFDVGLGPAVERLDWHMVRENPYNVSIRSAASGRVQPLGFIVELQYHHAAIGPFRLEARAQLRRFGKETTPGGAGYLNAPVSDNSGFIGLGVGMVL